VSGEPSESAAIVAEFDGLIHRARAVPLTDQVRLDRREIYGLLDRLRAALDHGPADLVALLDELDGVVHRAKPIPLTNQVRVERSEIYDVLDRMRVTLSSIADKH
jgi:hypothetical protein